MKTVNQPAKPHYGQLLNQALSEPGKLSTAYSAMHKFSVLNRALAVQQMIERGIEVSPLGSYGAWRKQGINVLKGHKGIALWMPVTIKDKTKEAEDDETGKIIFVMKPHWFALSQTDGWNNGEANLSGFHPEWDAERALDVLGVELKKFHDVNANKMGYATIGDNTIAINPMNPHPFKTLVHEMAHQIMHIETEWRNQPPAVLEVEAESVAFIVCATLGLADDDALSSSRAYIQGWASSFPGWQEKVPVFHAKRIFNTANRIIKAGEDFTDES
ncbi:MAG: DUF1738 domain-containing protein [Methyloprofundus sp.]|nr:DUF1738 domain-containing protein [Methyloprofundus sp.]